MSRERWRQECQWSSGGNRICLRKRRVWRTVSSLLSSSRLRPVEPALGPPLSPTFLWIRSCGVRRRRKGLSYSESKTSWLREETRSLVNGGEIQSWDNNVLNKNVSKEKNWQLFCKFENSVLESCLGVVKSKNGERDRERMRVWRGRCYVYI